MELEGTRVIHADRATVWAMLHNPAMLKAAIPGCTELTGTSETGYEAVAVQKVGPVKATFKGAVQMVDMVAPESYRITGEGKGGVAGFAKGGAEVAPARGRRRDGTEPTRPTCRWAASWRNWATASSAAFARKITDEFFDRFVTGIEAGGPPAG